MALKSPDIEQTISSRSGSDESSGPSPEQIAKRLDDVELLIEELGRSKHFIEQLLSYVEAKKGEVVRMQKIRLWAVILSSAFALCTIAIPASLFFGAREWLSFQETSLKIAVYLSSLTASVVIISILLRGSFSSVLRQGDETPLPPHIGELAEFAKHVIARDSG